ncbi:type III secretion system ATPase SctN [Hyphomicrobium sp. MC1]|uniref:type III secretion system ATPase SctN n=1 Tax=Hyphomicrobium sp. (strain MC1) TaxID=717785 RepID=UPI000213EFDE|nr:type III secretion system ATPase SctN [Hyphomicrobium sp. MC1]CCB66683.1 putative ATP synthase yscN [Hyphomicrobium sp. MC1]
MDALVRKSGEFEYVFRIASQAIAEATPITVRGRVLQVLGTIIKATVPGARIGDLCILHNPSDGSELPAEVVGLTRDSAILTPLGDLGGVSTLTEVLPTGKPHMAPAGRALLGRVLDGMGQPLDIAERGPLRPDAYVSVYADAPDPLTRRVIDTPMPLGVRALDGMLTCGEGQRMGIFAAAGGGKSTLMSMLVRGAAVDVTVMALIGERGREVREFIERDLGPEGREKSVVVVATSDRSSMERAKAAYVATAIAEWFRNQGMRVLFLMDSVTRFARAQREIGLAAGEPPTRRGFPPSVFATLPKLMERVGNNDKGSITAFYTVLVEGDDMSEPIADETRSILDGHIVLSRALSAANHFPAIDVLASASRVMGAIASSEHRALAGRIRTLMAKYNEVELLVRIGEYKPGSDKVADEAVKKIEHIRSFLKQNAQDPVGFNDVLKQMAEALA